ncbi:MAG: hypothetical protein VKJ46_05800 [Leptolyngbyaceae bacterium]|nr:hypothetical protein [Leptolyngbyaceae bacterium]
MVQETTHTQSSPDHAELELVRALLEPEETAYPWNPAEPETEGYFTDLEEAFTLSITGSNATILAAPKLISFCSQLWVQNSLWKQFSARIPQDLLDRIIDQAQQLLATPLSLADQLVQCVEAVLPNWEAEDLQILARPLAYAMRDNDAKAVELTLGTVRSIGWAELSEIEQARLSLVIAHHALAQLSTKAE